MIEAVRVYPDGSVDVTFPRKDPFTLVPHLGAVFLALLGDNGGTPARDGGLPFKNKRALANAVAEILGEPIAAANPAQTVVKYISKLANKLELADVVQKGPASTGYRLAVKRSCVPEFTVDL